MVSSEDRVNEIDKKIIGLNGKIIDVDNRIRMRLAGRLKADKIADNVEINEVLVHHGMLLAATSEKSALVAEKSALIMEKSAISVDKLSRSSERLEILTIVLMIITVFFAYVPIIELFKEFIPKPTLFILAQILIASVPFIILLLVIWMVFKVKKSLNIELLISSFKKTLNIK